MGLSFQVFLVVAAVDAYLAGHLLRPAACSWPVCRLVGTVGFMSFAVGSVFNSIWYNRPWRVTLSDIWMRSSSPGCGRVEGRAGASRAVAPRRVP